MLYAVEFALPYERDKRQPAYESIQDECPDVRGKRDPCKRRDVQDADAANDRRHDHQYPHTDVRGGVFPVKRSQHTRHFLVLRHRKTDPHRGVHRCEGRAEHCKSDCDRDDDHEREPVPAQHGIADQARQIADGGSRCRCRVHPCHLRSVSSGVNQFLTDRIVCRKVFKEVGEQSLNHEGKEDPTGDIPFRIDRLSRERCRGFEPDEYQYGDGGLEKHRRQAVRERDGDCGGVSPLRRMKWILDPEHDRQDAESDEGNELYDIDGDRHVRRSADPPHGDEPDGDRKQYGDSDLVGY